MNINEKKLLINFMKFLTKGKFYNFDIEETLKGFEQYLKEKDEI